MVTNIMVLFGNLKKARNGYEMIILPNYINKRFI